MRRLAIPTLDTPPYTNIGRQIQTAGIAMNPCKTRLVADSVPTTVSISPPIRKPSSPTLIKPGKACLRDPQQRPRYR